MKRAAKVVFPWRVERLGSGYGASWFVIRGYDADREIMRAPSGLLADFSDKADAELCAAAGKWVF